jgi:hypothetical protein
MYHRTLTCLAPVVLTIAIACVCSLAYALDERCIRGRKTAEQKRGLVVEYMSALQKAYDQKDFQIAEVLNFKINELRGQINELERNLAGCPKNDSENMARGLAPAKSDQGKYSDKSCSELRKMLFSLVRRVHTLTKRQKSLLSNLTDDEELELKEANKDMETVERVLKSKCSVRNARGLLRRLRR